MTERESLLHPESFASSLITVSWQLGDDVRLIRRTIASKEEEIGRVLERVLMEAFVLGHLREVDAFLDPRVVRNRWQAFVRRNGHDEPLRMNQTFADAQLQQGDRLLLRPLPQPHLPAESLTEDLLQQPPKTSGLLWVLLTLLAVGLAVGAALWFLRSTLWPPSPAQTTGKQRPHPPLPAIPTAEPHKGTPATTEPSTLTEPTTTEPPTLTEPATTEPTPTEPPSEPIAADAGSDVEEDAEDPPPARRIVPLRIKRPRKPATKRPRKAATKRPRKAATKRLRKGAKAQTTKGLRPSPPAVRLRRNPRKRRPSVPPRTAPSTEP